MSNYPPRVTGNEPAIAGPVEIDFTCIQSVPIATVYDFIDGPDGEKVLAVYQSKEVPCWFSGTADAYGPSFGYFHVECPVCGNEMEFEPKGERDDY